MLLGNILLCVNVTLVELIYLVLLARQKVPNEGWLFIPFVCWNKVKSEIDADKNGEVGGGGWRGGGGRGVRGGDICSISASTNWIVSAVHAMRQGSEMKVIPLTP